MKTSSRRRTKAKGASTKSLKKDVQSVIGTKSISQSEDALFGFLQSRLDVQNSVATWSYSKAGRITVIKVFFIDEETSLDIAVDATSIPDLKMAIETIDNYFIAKLQRS